MDKRTKLTEDNIYWSGEYHHLTILCDSKDYDQLKQQILDDSKKLEKITAFAKNLVYSNPHVSWQLKQLLRDAPPEPAKPKTVTYLVSCSKCSFEQDHEDTSLEKIKQFHEDWNDKNKAKMKCIHDYQYELKGQT